MIKLVWDFRNIEQLRREKSCRERRDISWLDISQETGISSPTILRARQAPFTPSMRTLIALSRYFEVPIDSWPHMLVEDGDETFVEPEAVESDV